MGRWKDLLSNDSRKWSAAKRAVPPSPSKSRDTRAPLNAATYPPAARRAFCGHSVGDIDAALDRAQREAKGGR